jgi:hypothetical protein
VRAGNHFAYRQLGHRRERVMPQLESCGPGPGALDPHVLDVAAHQLADARSPVHMISLAAMILSLGKGDRSLRRRRPLRVEAMAPPPFHGDVAREQYAECRECD